MVLETRTIKMLATLAAVTTALLTTSPASAQTPAAASCTTLLLTSFTPCFNFLTNSSNGGGGAATPTAECCRSLAALVSASTGCACLVLTGSVPLGGAPVNRTLAVTLPRACNSASVPLQCKDTSTEVPAPGPVAATPPLPPATTPATPESEPPASGSQGETRPAVLPSSAWRRSAHVAASLLLLAATLVG